MEEDHKQYFDFLEGLSYLTVDEQVNRLVRYFRLDVAHAEQVVNLFKQTRSKFKSS